jgi:DNA primase
VIPDEEIERVREAADIVGIIAEYVPLKRVGSDFRGPCPFHQGTHRNFSVSPRRRMYHCFVCNEGGDVFSFLQKRLGVDWPTAVRMVAARSGIELREVVSRRSEADPRAPIWELNKAAELFFQRCLWESEEGELAREYLASRGVERAAAERFGLGFAPRDGDRLREHLGGLGYDGTRLLEAGLFVRSDDGATLRPRFRNRLIFPIYDLAGQVAGFGGRLLGPGEPKYLNSADSPAFNKGRLLYGLNWARNAIRRRDRSILVEGYFDLVRAVLAGFEEAVAPLGTALTSEQAALLVRYSKNVFLAYDADTAGRKATFRAADELLRYGAAVRVVQLPAGLDPDAFLRQRGSEALERLVAKAKDVLELKIALLRKGGWFADLHKRRRAVDHLLPTLRATADPVTRDLYVGWVATAAGLDRNVLEREVSGLAGVTTVANRRSAIPRLATASRRTVVKQAGKRIMGSQRRTEGVAAERELLRVMLLAPAQYEFIRSSVSASDFRDPVYRELFEALLAAGPEAAGGTLACQLSAEASSAQQELLAGAEGIQDFERTAHDCVVRIRVRKLKERNAEIQRLLVTARGDEKDVLLSQKQSNVEEIRRLLYG